MDCQSMFPMCSTQPAALGRDKIPIASVKKLKPKAMPMYPTSGKIHIIEEIYQTIKFV